MIFAAPNQAPPDAYPTTVPDYSPPPALTPPERAIGDPVFASPPRFGPSSPSTPTPTPSSGGGATPPSGGPSIGYGYSPPPSGRTVDVAPFSGTDTTPTTLPTVTTWGSRVTEYRAWIGLSIAIAILIYVVYRRRKG
jgi:hypothetical protein